MTNEEVSRLLSWYVTQEFITPSERDALLRRWREGDSLFAVALRQKQDQFIAGAASEQEMNRVASDAVGPRPAAAAAGHSEVPFSAQMLAWLGWLAIVAAVVVGLLQLGEAPLAVALATSLPGVIGGAVLIGLGDIVRLLSDIRDKA